MTPDEQRWTGLAYSYNTYTGWCEEDPWVIDDLQMALKQFESIDNTKSCGQNTYITTHQETCKFDR